MYDECVFILDVQGIPADKVLLPRNRQCQSTRCSNHSRE